MVSSKRRAPGALGGGVLDLHVHDLGAAEQAADSLSILVVPDMCPHKSLSVLG